MISSQRLPREAAAVRRRRRRPFRRAIALLIVAATVAALVLALDGPAAKGNSFPPPSRAVLATMSVPQRIVAVAVSQVGYRTDPASSYCNKYSAYWGAGTHGCPSGEASEEWCADFAAWTWQIAGVQLTYGYAPDDINGAAVSFYLWAVANGQWHPATGYVAAPGDVAVYGLSLGTDPSAAHVAIVTSDSPGQRGPDVVNGDGDRTGFSVVELGTDQVRADADRNDATLAGFVSPP
jgi:hypothetical protein